MRKRKIEPIVAKSTKLGDGRTSTEDVVGTSYKKKPISLRKPTLVPDATTDTSNAAGESPLSRPVDH